MPEAGASGSHGGAHVGGCRLRLGVNAGPAGDAAEQARGELAGGNAGLRSNVEIWTSDPKRELRARSMLVQYEAGRPARLNCECRRVPVLQAGAWDPAGGTWLRSSVAAAATGMAGLFNIALSTSHPGKSRRAGSILGVNFSNDLSVEKSVSLERQAPPTSPGRAQIQVGYSACM